MPRPGVDVEIVDEAIGQQPILDTGQGFFVGKTERGPSWGRAGSLAEYEEKWGSRTGGVSMYDGVAPFFEEGGGSAIISKLDAAAAVKATANLGGAWQVDASSAGTWGNNIDVFTRQPLTGSTGAAGQPVYLQVMYNDSEVERSPTLYSVDDGIAWATAYSSFVKLGMGPGPFTLPVKDTTVALSTGTNGTAAVSDYDAALARFAYDQGPGQVVPPGITDPLVHAKIGAHCEAYHRVGLVDLPDTANAVTLNAARSGLDGIPGSRLLLACGSWYVYPTSASPATKIVPLSGVQTGIIARLDHGGDVSAVAAGKNGISRRAIGLAQVYSDDDREALNNNGVTLGRQMLGLCRTYGYRTAAGPDYKDNWTFFQESRIIMAVAHEGNVAIEDFVFDTLDGQGHLFTHIKNTLVGICMKYWQAGSLFGQFPEDSFRVMCDFSNNPLSTIKLGEIHATIYVRTSKVSEWVKIEIVKVPTERQVAA